MHILLNDCEPLGAQTRLYVFMYGQHRPKAEVYRGLQSCSVALSLLRLRVISTPVSAGDCCLPVVYLFQTLGFGSIVVELLRKQILSIPCSLIRQIWARDEAWSRAFSRKFLVLWGD